MPLVALMYRYNSDFRYLFFALSGMALLMFAGAIFMPPQVQKQAVV